MQKLLLLNKLLIAVLILSFNINTAFSQINLVLNPGFEIISGCPNSFGQIDSVIGWHKLINGGGGSPDLFNNCCTFQPYCGVPLNLSNTSFQYPKTGESYVGIEVARSTQISREYIQSKLLKKLSINNSYCVKFYSSLSDQSRAYINTLGVYLDNNNILAFSSFGLAFADTFLQPANPQLINTLQPFNDTINWMKIEGAFMATGVEEYITIGNFFHDSLSEILVFNQTSGGFWFSYYYIDDVSVIPTNLLAYAGNDTLIQPGDSVFIGRQPEIGLDEDCIWFVNGVPIDTVAGLWVQPDTTTTYVLQQTICGYVSWDTVTVSIDTGVGINKHNELKKFNLYPNPNTGSMTLDYILEKDESGIMVINDIAGRSVAEYTLNANSNSVVINENRLKNGIYYYSIYVNGIILKTNRIVIIK